MKIKTKSPEGIIYQVDRELDGIGTVTIDITYSGDTDENGKEILEFVYASVEEEDNDKLSLKQRAEANKILECGLEESVVLFLINEYRGTAINFDIGEYTHNPFFETNK
jgi:hypothetical protein